MRPARGRLGGGVALALALSLLLGPAGCDAGRAAPGQGGRDVAATGASVAARHDAAVARLAATRQRLAAAWPDADEAGRAALVGQARAALWPAVADELMPAWLGMPWGMGRTSTATSPHQPGMQISCSYFVAAVLQSAGLHLRDRFALGQAPALTIQRSLVGEDHAAVHRYPSISPAELADRIRRLGDGLYLIGLNIHVGFVVVRAGQVRFVHASYTGDQRVSDEPLASSRAIANSQPAGYFVSPLVVAPGGADEATSTWLLRQWIVGAVVGPSR
ncbi:MAG: hypothetical protein KBG28_22435 [Kofleriaceae bacterium]|nr:hypothetical protein [Kofleriaceae bacterium]